MPRHAIPTRCCCGCGCGCISGLLCALLARAKISSGSESNSNGTTQSAASHYNTEGDQGQNWKSAGEK
jgi:hypothetical protein